MIGMWFPNLIRITISCWIGSHFRKVMFRIDDVLMGMVV
jgi:hypothetical protein